MVCNEKRARVVHASAHSHTKSTGLFDVHRYRAAPVERDHARHAYSQTSLPCV